jgi:hypothetical protein
MSEAEGLAKMLDAFAASPHPRQIKDIAKQCGVSEQFVHGALGVLAPFGLFAKVGGTVSWRAQNPEVARLAARSLSRAIQENITLVGDWNAEVAEPKSPNDVFDTGSHLLWTMERRRFARGDKTPIYEENISRIVFKARGRDGSLYFLMHFGKNPQRFQLVGGRIEEGESAEDAAKRETAEEMPDARIEFGKDYKLSEPREISFFYQSTRTGAFTKFNVTHYVAIGMKGPPKLSANLRWVKLDEILQGETTEGNRILPAPQDVGPLIDLLSNAELSFTATIDPSSHMPVPAALPDGAERAVSSGPSTQLPRWFPFAGLGFTIVTILFLMYVVLGRPPIETTPFKILIAFCAAASLAFIGGNAAANGNIPLFKNSPVVFSVAGGVGAFVVIYLVLQLGP